MAGRALRVPPRAAAIRSPTPEPGPRPSPPPRARRPPLCAPSRPQREQAAARRGGGAEEAAPSRDRTSICLGALSRYGTTLVGSAGGTGSTVDSGSTTLTRTRLSPAPGTGMSRPGSTRSSARGSNCISSSVRLSGSTLPVSDPSSIPAPLLFFSALEIISMSAAIRKMIAMNLISTVRPQLDGGGSPGSPSAMAFRIWVSDSMLRYLA